MQYQSPHSQWSFCRIQLELLSDWYFTLFIIFIFIKIIPLKKNIIIMSLLNHLQQVETFQLKLANYHKFFKENMHPSTNSDQNQFLDPSLHQDYPQTYRDQDVNLFQAHKISVISNIEPHAQDTQTPQIYQSHIVKHGLKEDVNLSRIFQDIVLGNETISNHPFFDIKFTHEGQQYPITLTRKNQYSLSNFNSFSNNQQTSLDFSQLLQKIQKQTGKTISPSGIQHILTQLEQFSSTLLQTYQSQSSTTRQTHVSCLSQTNFNHEQPEKHIFDNVLNKHAFNRKKSSKNNLSQLNNKEEKELWLQPEELMVPAFNKKNHAKYSFQKQNRHAERSKNSSLYAPFQRQLKISKKGKEFVLTNLDTKQIDIFCITNKIFGRQKDKIIRAVNSPKPHLTVFLE